MSKERRTCLWTVVCRVAFDFIHVLDTMMSMTFGAAIGEWVPGLFNMGDVNSVYFATWQKATDSRWEVQVRIFSLNCINCVKEFGSTSSESLDAYCVLTGNYNFEFFDGCNELHVSIISDSCRERADFLQNEFTLVERPEAASCLAAGTELVTTLGESETLPRISGNDAVIVFGMF